jgi:hypothetical protein
MYRISDVRHPTHYILSQSILDVNKSAFGFGGRITLIRGVRYPQMPNGAASGDAGSSFAPKNERTLFSSLKCTP